MSQLLGAAGAIEVNTQSPGRHFPAPCTGTAKRRANHAGPVLHFTQPTIARLWGLAVQMLARQAAAAGGASRSSRPSRSRRPPRCSKVNSRTAIRPAQFSRLRLSGTRVAQPSTFQPEVAAPQLLDEPRRCATICALGRRRLPCGDLQPVSNRGADRGAASGLVQSPAAAPLAEGSHSFDGWASSPECRGKLCGKAPGSGGPQLASYF